MDENTKPRRHRHWIAPQSEAAPAPRTVSDFYRDNWSKCRKPRLTRA